MSYPIPPNEEEKNKKIRYLDILDNLQEEEYDSITRLVSELFDTPVALITILDQDKQWYKSRIGLNHHFTSRDEAFCNYNILDDDIFVVPDALEDERFIDNPSVKEDPNIRFYAGAPLNLGRDMRIGSLCVIDFEPRDFSEKDKLLLKSLANHVSGMLRARETALKLIEMEQRYLKLLNVLPICSWCKRIKHDHQSWAEIDEFLQKYEGRMLTHSICPECSDQIHEQILMEEKKFNKEEDV